MTASNSKNRLSELMRTWSRPAAWAAFTGHYWSAMVVFFSTLGGHALREAPWFLAPACWPWATLRWVHGR